MNEPSPDNNTLADRSTSMVDKELIQDTLSPEKRCPECDNGQYCGVGPCPKCHPEAYVTSNERLTPEKLAEYREIVPLGIACGVGGAALAALLDEIERLTRERDEARNASVPGSATVFAAIEAERDRLRAALEEAVEGAEEIAPGIVKVSPWSTWWLNRAKALLSGEPSAHETSK